MRAAYVFRQPGGQEWVEVASQESIKDPKPHFATSGSGEGKPELLTTGEAPPLLTRQQLPLSETLRLLQRNSWEAGISKLACLPSCLQGLEAQLPEAFLSAESPWLLSHPLAGVVWRLHNFHPPACQQPLPG